MNDGNNGTENRPVSPVNGQPLPIGRPFVTGDSRAREAQLKGAATKRARRTLREELLALLSGEITDKKGRTVQAQTAMSNAILKEALSGNTKAFEVIRDTIGEKPVDKVMVADVDQEIINEVEKAVLEEKPYRWVDNGDGSFTKVYTREGEEDAEK